MQRKRKLEQEMEEVKSREADNKMDYQREKQEISKYVDQKEMEHLQDIRMIKDQIIEAEVETKK